MEEFLDILSLGFLIAMMGVCVAAGSFVIYVLYCTSPLVVVAIGGCWVAGCILAWIGKKRWGW